MLRLAVKDIALLERPVRFNKPFRFGSVTVEGAPQAFVRAEIEVEGYGRASGATAELMVPKWFDKNDALGPEDTINELRRSLAIARDLYLTGSSPDTAFGWHAARIEQQVASCMREGIPALAGAYGPAEIDKAILDALLRALGIGVYEGLRRNIAGLDNRLTRDLDPAALSSFLAARAPLSVVALRHTIGLLDPLEGEHGLAAAIEKDGYRYFKLKLGGDVEKDMARLAEIGRVIEWRAPASWVTLDANEQYASTNPLEELVDALNVSPQLKPIRSRLLYIEQPMPRERSGAAGLGRAAQSIPFIIDESDDGYEAFLQARERGYRGVSSKSCKGLYKSLLNGARAAAWNHKERAPTYFIAAEDLTCQAGLAVQQDTALASFLGIAHVERNGHQYGAGFGTAPASEASAFAEAHPDLYRCGDDGIVLRIRDGELSIGSLAAPGFASGAHPDWGSLESLSTGAGLKPAATRFALCGMGEGART